jgi:hypothetical protein
VRSLRRIETNKKGAEATLAVPAGPGGAQGRV